jgi:hypothetical protein
MLGGSQWGTHLPHLPQLLHIPQPFMVSRSSAFLFLSAPRAVLHFAPISALLSEMVAFGRDVFPVVLGGGVAVFLVLRWIIASEHERESTQEGQLSSARKRPLSVRVTLLAESDQDSVRALFVKQLNSDLRAAGFGSADFLPSDEPESRCPRTVSFELNLYELEAGLEFARRRLRELGAPRETWLKYHTEQGQEVSHGISSGRTRSRPDALFSATGS